MVHKKHVLCKKGTVHVEQVLFKKEVRYNLSMHYLKEECGAGGGRLGGVQDLGMLKT